MQLAPTCKELTEKMLSINDNKVAALPLMKYFA